MSTYYDYYIGYKTKDDKIYPLLPFDCNGNMYPIVSKSRSFASNLYQDFWYINKDNLTDEFISAFINTDGNCDDKDINKYVEGGFYKWLPLDEIGSGDFIEDGYFLIKDIERYIKYPNERYEIADDMHYTKISKELYAIKLQNELTFGYQEEKDEFDNVISSSCKEYAYFAFPNYDGKEYEVHSIFNAAKRYNEYKLPKDAELVAICCIG